MSKFTIKILHTTDIHGCFFPFDFIEGHPCKGSMARIASYVMQMRYKYGQYLLLLDCSDVLLAQPSCSYCNYVEPSMEIVDARVIHVLGDDLQV